jgi:hypothetical protein
VVCEVNGPNIDENLDKIREQKLGGDEFGFSVFDHLNLSSGMIVFDELGGPVTGPQSSTPAPAQSFGSWAQASGSGQRRRVHRPGHGRVAALGGGWLS